MIACGDASRGCVWGVSDGGECCRRVFGGCWGCRFVKFE